MTDLKNKNNFSLTAQPTALVAGGAGFVGSFLCQSLLFQGCRVISVDNLSTGRRENLSHCFGNPNFFFEEHNLTKTFALSVKPDYIFAVAGMENYCVVKPKLLQINTEGTLKLLQLARKSNAKFLLASTDSLPAVGYRGIKNILSRQKNLSRLQSARNFAEGLVLNFREQGLDAKIARLSQLYGPRMNLNSASEINVLFASFFGIQSRYQLWAEKTVCPLFISDAVFGLMKLMFSADDEDKSICSLRGSEELSFYDLCQRLGKLTGQSCRLHFSQAHQPSEPENSSISAPDKWQPEVGLDEGLKRTINFFQNKKNDFNDSFQNEERLKSPLPAKKLVVEEVSRQVLPASVEKKTRRISPIAVRKIGFQGGKIIASLFIFLLLGLLPIIPLGFKSMMVSWYGWRSIRAIERNEPEKWLNSANRTYYWATGVEREVEKISQLVPFWEWFNLDLEREAWYLKKASLINWQAAKLVSKTQEWGGVVFGEGVVGQTMEVENIESTLEQIWWELTYLENDLKLNQTSPLLLGLLARKTGYEIDSNNLARWRQSFYQFKTLVPQLPNLLGFDGKKTYLVLLQNNMELRPTGGFIGSFALIGFENGKLIQNEVYDVYDADGQLKGHVEPPLPIKNYLGEAGWYLRDSNWDPNFPGSGLKASWFLEKTMGVEVDGVISLNLFFAQKLLELTGPLELTDYGENVEFSNLYELAQRHAQDEFFPGSKEKKDFLGALARNLILKIENEGVRGMWVLVRTILQTVEQKEVFFWLKSDGPEELMGEYNWDGSLRQPTCLGNKNCFLDYLMLVEANLGVNKVNYYLKREVNVSVDLSMLDQIKNRLEIKYSNKSQVEDLYGGDYKNYLRVYMPLGARVDQVHIDGKILESKEIDEQLESGKQVAGFLVLVPAGKNVSVIIDYHQQRSTSDGYTLYFQRQSGSDRSKLDLKISLPAGFVPETVFGGQLINGQFESRWRWDRDLVVGF